MSNKVIKAELKKPYTERERVDFIVEQNHKNGYIIDFLEDGSLQAYEIVKTEEEIAQEKEDIINHLTMTALDLVTYIKKAGVPEETIMAYLQANPSVQLQLTLCQNVYCGIVRQLCPIKVTEELSITDSDVVKMFKDKNGITE